MEGAAHDYSVASHNGLTASELCPGGCLGRKLTEHSLPCFSLQLHSFKSVNGSACLWASLFMVVFLSKYAHGLLQSLQKRHVSNCKREQILLIYFLCFFDIP